MNTAADLGALIGEVAWRRQQATDDARVKETLHEQLNAAGRFIKELQEEIRKYHGAACKCSLCTSYGGSDG